MKRAFILTVIVAICAMTVGSVRNADACIGVCTQPDVNSVMQDLLRINALNWGQQPEPWNGWPGITGGDGVTIDPGPDNNPDLVPDVLDPTMPGLVPLPDPVIDRPVGGDGVVGGSGIARGPDGTWGVVPGKTPKDPTFPGGVGGTMGPPDNDKELSHRWPFAIFTEESGFAQKCCNTQGFTATLHPGTRMASGSVSVIATVSDYGSPTQITDSAGNTWIRAGYTPSSQGTVTILTSRLKHNAGPGDILNFNLNGQYNGAWSWSMVEIVGQKGHRSPVSAAGSCTGTGSTYKCGGVGGTNWLQTNDYPASNNYTVETKQPNELVITAAFTTDSTTVNALTIPNSNPPKGDRMRFLGTQGWVTLADLPFAPSPYAGRRYLAVEAGVVNSRQVKVRPHWNFSRNGGAISVALKVHQEDDEDDMHPCSSHGGYAGSDVERRTDSNGWVWGQDIAICNDGTRIKVGGEFVISKPGG